MEKPEDLSQVTPSELTIYPTKFWSIPGFKDNRPSPPSPPYNKQSNTILFCACVSCCQTITVRYNTWARPKEAQIPIHTLSRKFIR